MVRRGSTLVAVLSIAALGLFSASVAGQGTPTPAASPGAGTAVAQTASPAASPGATPLAGEVDLAAAERGKAVAMSLCIGCHTVDGKTLVGPTWKGIYRSEVELEGGAKVTVDDAYLKESILDPMKATVKGFPPAMPPYKSILTEEQLKDVIEYIKSLQ